MRKFTSLLLFVGLICLFNSCYYRNLNNEDLEVKLAKILNKIEAKENYRINIFSVDIKIANEHCLKIFPRNKDINYGSKGDNGYMIIVNVQFINHEELEILNNEHLSEFNLEILPITALEYTSGNPAHEIDGKYTVPFFKFEQEPEKVLKVATSIIKQYNKEDQKKISINIVQHDPKII